MYVTIETKGKFLYFIQTINLWVMSYELYWFHTKFCSRFRYKLLWYSVLILFLTCHDFALDQFCYVWIDSCIPIPCQIPWPVSVTQFAWEISTCANYGFHNNIAIIGYLHICILRTTISTRKLSKVNSWTDIPISFCNRDKIIKQKTYLDKKNRNKKKKKYTWHIHCHSKPL